MTHFAQLFSFLLLTNLVRYFVVAGAAWAIFWAWDNPFTARRRIQQRPFRTEEVRREILWSLSSAAIFAAVLALSFQELPRHLPGWPRAPEVLFDLGRLAVLLLVHDAWFYWMHRTVHHPALFPVVHRVHHLSRNPSPFAAYSFHPLEALCEAIWVIPARALLGGDAHVWIAFGMVMMTMNVLGHLNVELYPDWFRTHPVLRWLNFSTLHSRHHRQFRGNYGLYLSFWDRVMGTLVEDGAAASVARASDRCESW